MTRVVPDQKSKFETDELFRKLSRESEVRYTGYRDRTHEERIVRFQSDCKEGRCPVAFSGSGTNLLLYLGPPLKDKKNETPTKEYLDFDKEIGKAHLKSRFVMNGVCVTFRGIIDLQRLDGMAYLEHDNEFAKIEDKILRDTIEKSRLRMQEFEEHQRRVKQEPLEGLQVQYGGSDYSGMTFHTYLQ